MHHFFYKIMLQIWKHNAGILLQKYWITERPLNPIETPKQCLLYQQALTYLWKNPILPKQADRLNLAMTI